jgi:alpha/beta superfamily hydrolase
VQAPVTVIYGSADDAAFGTHSLRMYAAIRHDKRELVCLDGANHYFIGQPNILADLVDRLVGIAENENRWEHTHGH